MTSNVAEKRWEPEFIPDRASADIKMIDDLERYIIESLDTFIQVEQINAEDEKTFVRVMTIIYRNLNLTQKELAFMLGVTEPTISRWLAGRTTPFKRDRKQVLVTALKIVRRKLDAKD